MRAIEIASKTDNRGHLRIDCQLDCQDRDVRVLILLNEDSSEVEEQLWMSSISRNPAFDFLSDPREDIYSAEDGEPLK